MQIELRNTDEIKPYESNPRVNDQAVEAVAVTLKEFGFRQPIVIGADGVIIAGHTRWKAVPHPSTLRPCGCRLLALAPGRRQRAT